VTKPPPLAVSVNPGPPTVAEPGLTTVSVEEDVWTVRFVLNWEHPAASPHTASTAISHLREYIRTRSSPIDPCETPTGENPARTIQVPRKPATIQ